jgi:tRNA 5-methylaminomethyl-2-thiouridine biosynthesis bifunctional protein
VLTADDGVHARWHRAAALAFAPLARLAVADGVAGDVGGLLRLERELPGLDAMQALLDRLGLPPDYVRAMSAEQASDLAGIAVPERAWLYPGGGWISPRGLALWFLRRAGDAVSWCGGVDVGALRHDGGQWCLTGHDGCELARSSTVVLANAGDALRLAGTGDWPLDRVRGQVSMAPAAELVLPRLPLADAGYVLPAVDGLALFGATAQRGDTDASVRDADNAENLDKLSRLLGVRVSLQGTALQGRVGWRWSAPDRLPVIGAVPDAERSGAGSADQPRLLPRHEGLFVYTALGSRGIGMSALGARLLAAWVTGAPSPVEASLMDAVDPARFAARARRKPATGSRPPAAEG